MALRPSSVVVHQPPLPSMDKDNTSCVPETPVATVSRSSTATTAVWNANIPRFEKSYQLCNDLEYTRRDSEKGYGLCNRGSRQTLPDAPRIPLDSCRLIPYCLEDLEASQPDKLGDNLWFTGPTPVIRPLSTQLTIGRRILLTEEAKMHCVWDEELFFLKPLPAYICSFAFWEYILEPENDGINREERDRLRSTALGFLRTYSSLIRRRSDFAIAREHKLLDSFPHVSFEDFSHFIEAFDKVPESAVSPRWRFGELPLGMLNFYSFIFLRRWHLRKYEQRYGAYFEAYFPVVLFVFAVFSVMLSAMQVILASYALWDTDIKGLKRTLGGTVWFGWEAIGWSGSFALIFFVWWIVISTGDELKKLKVKKEWKKKLALESALQA